jgi:hypothetical protein
VNEARFVSFECYTAARGLPREGHLLFRSIAVDSTCLGA